MMNSKTTEIDVSVVIVCMNNYGQLTDCLDSIKKYTQKVSYEVLLVAYFFSDENLKKLITEYSWVTIILSNEIRGFSANNNLALRQAQGRYCFVLNDDTYMKMSVLDNLVETMDLNSNITLLSPQILRPDGTIQYSGIPPIDWKKWLRILYKIDKEREDPTGIYIRKEGMFRTYNILGAAFLIRTEVFRSVGFFDEYYFFGPEDKALSMLLNKKGYECWVDADIRIVHLGGATGGVTSQTVTATRPAERKGSVMMYAENKKTKEFFLSLMVFIYSFLLLIFWTVRYILGGENAYYSLVANINVCRTIFTNMTPTDIFMKFYCKND